MSKQTAPTPAVTIPEIQGGPRSVAVPAGSALGLGETENADFIKGAFDRSRAQQPPEPFTLPQSDEAEEPEPGTASAEPLGEPEEPASEPAAAPAEPITVTVGGKKYTQAELEVALTNRNTPTPPPEPQAKQEAPAAPTSEEISKRETDWVDQKASEIKFEAPTPDDIENLLGGGVEAGEWLAKFQAKTVASALLHARKSIFEDLSRELLPQLEALQNQVTPVYQQQQVLARYTAEQAFVTKYPDFVPHIDTARKVAEAIVVQFPNEVSTMSQEDFLAEVARQSDRVLQQEFSRWNKTEGASWKAPTPVTPPPAPRTRPRPPASNTPASTPTPPSQSWNKSVAASLRG
jgi:hypothetical protein